MEEIILKCKMCGGTLKADLDKKIAVCDSCGTEQTIPSIDDERKINIFDRANHLRLHNEYDKALTMYEKLLELDHEDAEVYWSIVLCKYGIEYVDDPVSHKRVPTINRTQYSSILLDSDYKTAVDKANEYQRKVYEEEAKHIANIQKEILEISSKEEPFDVFICYKETDNNGRRTHDSVLANDLYHQLIQEGFKVFFARITLEDKLGTEYEPYIFAALNSAKVMVVLGTNKDYFNAVWVKNEWSRFLTLMQNDNRKTLIPAYKDMDPYDLPEEFSYLQAQDMSKLGFMSDLVRGIKKILSSYDSEEKQEIRKTDVQGNTHLDALIKRAKMALEDGEFVEADKFCEQILNYDAENSEIYMLKLLVSYEVCSADELLRYYDGNGSIENNVNYKRMLRFADLERNSTLKAFVDQVEDKELNYYYEKQVEQVSFLEQKKFLAEVAHYVKEGKVEKASLCIESVKNLKQWFSDNSTFRDSRTYAEKIAEIEISVLDIVKKKLCQMISSSDVIVQTRGICLMNRLSLFDDIEEKNKLDYFVNSLKWNTQLNNFANITQIMKGFEENGVYYEEIYGVLYGRILDHELSRNECMNMGSSLFTLQSFNSGLGLRYKSILEAYNWYIDHDVDGCDKFIRKGKEQIKELNTVIDAVHIDTQSLVYGAVLDLKKSYKELRQKEQNKKPVQKQINDECGSVLGDKKDALVNGLRDKLQASGITDKISEKSKSIFGWFKKN